MEKFVCKLADVNIEVNAVFHKTKLFCKDYIVDDKPDFKVEVSKDDILNERLLANNNQDKDSIGIVNYSDEYLETLALYRKIVSKLVDYNAILFHGSAIAFDNEAYLFTAKSGTGKSTHTALWRRVFDNHVFMVNDDKPLIRIKEDKVYIYGTPWDGKHHLSRNCSIPLKAICKLGRESYNHIDTISKQDMFIVCMQQVYVPKEKDLTIKTINLINKVLDNVKMYNLGCNMQDEAAIIAYEGMK